ncbi:MAG TPA: ABC transporter permease [Terriglobales bacterium]|nr:ABC transporter permease [Terriglobales bacterium]
MNNLLQDLRFALRQLRKTPGFTAVVVITLALGIGANTALFSVVDAVLFRPLPYRSPQQLVAIHDELTGVNLKDAGMSVQEVEDLQNRSGVFDQVSVVWPIDANVTGREKPERIEGLAVSLNYFTMLGANPELGRVFAATDYRPGLFEGAVISDGLWHRMFGADPAVVGRGIRMDSDLYTIIGVMPPGFRHPGRTLRSDVDVWISGGFVGPPFPQPPRREIRLFPGAIGRIKPELTLQQAQAKLDGFVTQLRQQYPTDYPAAARWSVELNPLHEEVVGNTGKMLFVLLAAVGMVLLVACVNIASLLLARSSVRQREMALRQALGARAARLVRQMLTESVMLSLLGGILAILLSVWLKDVLLDIVPPAVTRLAEVAVNIRVLGFALGISLITGLAFGLAPAMQLASPRLMDELRHGTRGSVLGLRQHRFLSALVISEFALSLILLVGAGLLLRSLWNVMQVSPGFATNHLVVARVWLPVPNDPKLNPYLKQENRTVFVREVLRRVSALPGVEQAAIGSGSTPFSGQIGLTNFTIEGSALGRGESPAAEIGSLTPDFSRALGTTLVRGRSFTDADSETGNPVALIDQTAAERYWPNEDPIGKRVQLNIPGAVPTPPLATIVGIIGRMKSEGLDVPYSPHMLFPAYQNVGIAMSIYARTSADARSLQDAIRPAVQSVDPNLPIFGVRSMETIVSDSLAPRRFALQLMALFAVTALVLSVIGIYGVMAYFVSLRVREIGVRMALGAQRADVLKMIVSRGMILAAAGAAIGIVASLMAARLIAGFLFGVSTHDPMTVAGFTAVLSGAALAANYIPARRAAKVDPMVALRYE